EPRYPRSGKLGQLAPQPVDESGLRLDRNEIGLGEVAVVLRLLLRAVRRQRVGVGLVVVRLLLDLAAPVVERRLLADRRLYSAPDESKRIHVLQLPTRAQLVGARRADGNVGIAAERPLLHARVRDPELDDRLAQELKEPARLVGRPDV